MSLLNICVMILPMLISTAVTSFLYTHFFNDHINISHNNLLLSTLHSKILLLVILYRYLSLTLKNQLLSLLIHLPSLSLHLRFLLTLLMITYLFPTYSVMMSYLILIFNITSFYSPLFHYFHPL